MDLITLILKVRIYSVGGSIQLFRYIYMQESELGLLKFKVTKNRGIERIPLNWIPFSLSLSLFQDFTILIIELY